MVITTTEQSRRLQKLLEAIEIPRSYYERTIARYTSIREWLCRAESVVARYNPTVYAQGSFRLGLVNRPLGPTEEYDLDLVCELQSLTKGDVTQEQLKTLLGQEIATYAKAHGIEEPVTESKRCWRIDYADEVKFHIDNLPCIPEDEATVSKLLALGVPYLLAYTAIALTCNEHPEYKSLTADWPTSNPNGFARWFEERFGTPGSTRRIRLVEAGFYSSVEKVPVYALKTPLQQSIQVLKRHRDVMFKEEPRLKPISMIITTLSALAYQGEDDLYESISGIIERMPSYVRSSLPRIPNPVNPGEDFANKWASDPALEENFWIWYQQAARDFREVTGSQNAGELRKFSESRFGVPLSIDDNASPAVSAARRVAPAIVVERGPKPWA